MAQKSDKNDDALAGLDALILQARKRLAPNPDYIVLQALEKARAEIAHAAYKATAGDDEIIDDTTGEVLRIISTGKLAPTHGKPSQLLAAEIALSRAGEPLPISVLVERVRALGAKVGGKTPNINLGSTLSRSEKYESVRFHGSPAWWFKGMPVPDERMAAE
jgi:hypothetical protein